MQKGTILDIPKLENSDVRKESYLVGELTNDIHINQPNNQNCKKKYVNKKHQVLVKLTPNNFSTFLLFFLEHLKYWL